MDLAGGLQVGWGGAQQPAEFLGVGPQRRGGRVELVGGAGGGRGDLVVQKIGGALEAVGDAADAVGVERVRQAVQPLRHVAQRPLHRLDGAVVDALTLEAVRRQLHLRPQVLGHLTELRPLLAEGVQLLAQPRHLGARLSGEVLDAGDAVVDLGGAGHPPGEHEQDDRGQAFQHAQAQKDDAAEHDRPPESSAGRKRLSLL